MRQLSFERHRFPADIIRHSVWLYARFTLSYRDVEEILAKWGLEVSYKTVRRWFLKFGSTVAANLRRTRLRPSDRWHLDEMVIVTGLRATFPFSPRRDLQPLPPPASPPHAIDVQGTSNRIVRVWQSASVATRPWLRVGQAVRCSGSCDTVGGISALTIVKDTSRALPFVLGRCRGHGVSSAWEPQ